ncbi:MAG: caspase family protein [Bacteroidota bacterium]
MSKGISLHIGVNIVDKNHYGTDGKLLACEADARSMQKIAASQGFTTNMLLTFNATRKAVITTIKDAAKVLQPNDTFLVSYAGHGSYFKDRSGDEDDGYDETWCLYDSQLIDDELRMLWGKFQAGVKIVIVSDSCHSGTVSRAPGEESGGMFGEGPREDMDPAMNERFRFLPKERAADAVRSNKQYYQQIFDSIPKEVPEPKASIILFSGCQDNQQSKDGDHNGLFTSYLLRAWKDGGFNGSYEDLYNSINKSMKRELQRPNFDVSGNGGELLAGMPPFKIG